MTTEEDGLVTVQLHIYPDELEELKKTANNHGMSLNTAVRRAVMLQRELDKYLSGANRFIIEGPNGKMSYFNITI